MGTKHDAGTLGSSFKPLSSLSWRVGMAQSQASPKHSRDFKARKNERWDSSKRLYFYSFQLGITVRCEPDWPQLNAALSQDGSHR